MCRAMGCACLPQSGQLPYSVAAASADRFGVGVAASSASVSGRDAVGSMLDRFRWSHPISHDWPAASHTRPPQGQGQAQTTQRLPLAPRLQVAPGAPPALQPPGFASSSSWGLLHQDIKSPVAPFQPAAFLDTTTLATTLSTLTTTLSLAPAPVTTFTTATATPAADPLTDADMEFSKRDLEDIQRVAGLLNLTVDELLQQSRAHTETTPQPPSPQDSSPPLQQSAVFVPEDLVLPDQHHHHTPYLDADSDLVDLGDSGLQSGSSRSGFADFSYPASVAPDQASTEVILLNPYTAWYDCDAPFSWDPNQAPDQGFNLGGFVADPELAGEGSYVPGSEMEIDSEVASDYTARDPTQASAQESAQDEVLTDWAVVSASSEALAVLQSPISGASGSTSGNYHKIAPRLGKKSQPAIPDTSSRIKKKRGRYEGSKRVATHLTRQLHACVRCRMQRNRVR